MKRKRLCNMQRRVGLILGVLATTSALIAADKKLDIPGDIKAAIARDYPQGTVVSIEKTKDVFAIQVKAPEGTTTAQYDKNGRWILFEKPITLNDDSTDAKNCRALATYIEPPGFMGCTSAPVANPTEKTTVVNPKGTLVSASRAFDGPNMSHYELAISFCGNVYKVDVSEDLQTKSRSTGEEDNTEAISRYRKAAEAGDGEGMTKLGNAYENGLGGLSADQVQAVSWYRKAASAGDVGPCAGPKVPSARDGPRRQDSCPPVR